MADQVTVVEQGDWLIPYKCEEPHKVRQISYQEEPAGKWTIITFEGKDFGETWYYPASCKPIPLTKEILEKNGFVSNLTWHHCDIEIGNYIVCVQFGYNNKIWYVKIHQTGKDNVVPSEKTSLYLTHIQHVHQLQHALRLCGIEMKFEL